MQNFITNKAEGKHKKHNTSDKTTILHAINRHISATVQFPKFILRLSCYVSKIGLQDSATKFCIVTHSPKRQKLPKHGLGYETHFLNLGTLSVSFEHVKVDMNV